MHGQTHTPGATTPAHAGEGTALRPARQCSPAPARTLMWVAVALLLLQGASAPGAPRRGIINGDFECGDLRGWKADPNWTVDDNSAGGWYSGWQGKRFAFSGKGGEQATGKLRSAPFVLDRDGVEVWIAGWADVWGRTADRWNYVTLNLATSKDAGKELDRVYAPNSVTFTPVVLDGSGYRGRQVYVEAVDNAPQSTFSMLCIDQVRTVALPAAAPLPRFDPRRMLRLENRWCRVEVSRTNGSIVRIRDQVGGLELIREPRLADSFRFSLPLPGKESWQATEGNYILGRQQRLTSFRQRPGALELLWKGPLRSEQGKLYPVDVLLRISLERDTIRFGLTIHNHTRFALGEVYAPVLGGLVGLGSRADQRKRTEMALPVGGGVQTSRPFHTFQNMSPFGVLYPEQYYAYPATLSMPWMHLYERRSQRGVSLMVQDPVYRYKVLHLEMVPGLAGPRAEGNWPRPEELGGLPAGVRVSSVHFPYQSPGKTFAAAPVVLWFHGGGWQETARRYGEWMRSVQGSRPAAPAWLREAGAVQECRSVPFGELPRWARDGLEHGVRVLLVSGWKAGGDEDGVPLFVPDPRLGGPGALADAVRQCHELGVRVILTAGVGLVSTKTDWYRREGHRYTCLDRWGVPFSELAGDGERRVWVNLAVPAFREAFREQMAQLVRLGIDGVHLQGVSPPWLDFNPELRRAALPLVPSLAAAASPDQAAWQGVRLALQEAWQACRVFHPSFCFTAEDARDHILFLSPVAQAAAPDTSPLRLAFPWWRPMVPVTNGDARSAANEALRLGGVARITLRGGTTPLGHEDARDVAPYLRDLLRIRESLRDLLVDGDWLGSQGAAVEGNVSWSVFRAAGGRAYACVIVNAASQPAMASLPRFTGYISGPVAIHRPLAPPQEAALPVTLEVPARSVAVVATSR